MRRLATPSRGSSRAARAMGALVLALAVLGGGTTPSSAWTNGAGDGYETHDWIIDQALHVLDGRVDAWFDRLTALHASDDPDHIEPALDPSRGIEHMYREAGRRGGAIHRIAEHYAAAVRLYRAGAGERAAGEQAAGERAWTGA